MKICLVAELFFPNIGGGEKYLLELAENLAKEGHEIRVLTSWKSGSKTKNLKRKNLEINYYNWPDFFGHPLPQQSDLRAHFIWADIVHTSLYTAALGTWWTNLTLPKAQRRPLALTVFEVIGNDWWLVEKNWLKATAFYAFEKLCINLNFKAFLPISQATSRSLIKARWKKPVINQVIYPKVSCITKKTSVNCELKEKQKNNKPFFLNYGRPGQTKGINLLLTAIAQISRKHPTYPIKFKLILGSEPSRERVKLGKYAADNIPKDLIEIQDSLPYEKLQQQITFAQTIIIPSITEGFGYSAFEACCAGKKIIVSRSGSLPEVVFGKVIFFRKNDAADLKVAIEQALLNHFKKVAPPATICNNQQSYNLLSNIYLEMNQHAH